MGRYLHKDGTCSPNKNVKNPGETETERENQKGGQGGKKTNKETDSSYSDSLCHAAEKKRPRLSVHLCIYHDDLRRSGRSLSFVASGSMMDARMRYTYDTI